jgi:AAA15 family ATPase/GTPase
MLNALRIQNLRSLHDTGFVKLRPITILVGENSCGKSTFLRTFPLLRQSVETDTRSSILWFGKYVDFGDFDQAKSRGSSSKEIIFSFELSIPAQAMTTPYRLIRNSTKNSSHVAVTVDLRLAPKGKDGLTRTSGIDINIENNKIRIDINESGKISELQVNGNSYPEHIESMSYTPASRLLPVIRGRQDKSAAITYSWRDTFNLVKPQEHLIEAVKKFAHGNIEKNRLAYICRVISIGSDADVLKSIQKASSTITWQKKTKPLTTDNADFIRIRDLSLLLNIPIFIFSIDDILDSTFKKVSYIAPLRASAERYYRSQDLSVRELDSKGENLAMFVRNLSEKEKSSLDSWTNEHFGFHLEVKYNGGHVIAGIEYEKTKEHYNIADMGFGFSQVMPIIVQIWTLIHKPTKNGIEDTTYTYAIEQPELHLHPRMQAKIAEVLAKAVILSRKNEILLNLIIETHSETIINKIGLMIADGEINSEDTNIIIVSKENESSASKIDISKYDSEGTLINWPYGFFDIEV